MADSYWIWSHGLKVYDDDNANPLYLRFTQDQLDSLTDEKHMAVFIGRSKTTDDEYFLDERQRYIVEHALEYERVMVGYPYRANDEPRVMKVQYARVLMEAARAVEFKMRYHIFDINTDLYL